MIDTYTQLIDSAKLIHKAKRTVSDEDGTLTSPAWLVLHHAERYVLDQANVVLRGTDPAISAVLDRTTNP